MCFGEFGHGQETITGSLTGNLRLNYANNLKTIPFAVSENEQILLTEIKVSLNYDENIELFRCALR